MKRSILAVVAVSASLALGACTSPQTESLDRIADAQEVEPAKGSAVPAPQPRATASSPYDRAPGGSMEQAYISTLDSEGIDYSTEANAIEAGKSICDLMDTGLYDLFETVEFFSDNSGYEIEQSGFIVGAALAAFCPENL